MLAGKGPLKAFVCSRLRACGRARARSDRCADIHLVVCVRARMRTHKQNCTCARTHAVAHASMQSVSHAPRQIRSNDARLTFCTFERINRQARDEGANHKQRTSRAVEQTRNKRWPWAHGQGGLGGVQIRERGQCGDRRRHASAEAVRVNDPAPPRAVARQIESAFAAALG